MGHKGRGILENVVKLKPIIISHNGANNYRCVKLQSYTIGKTQISRKVSKRRNKLNLCVEELGKNYSTNLVKENKEGDNQPLLFLSTPTKTTGHG